ncbi:hypothetical protein Ddye_028660, partial [Dipteronia dyeriana]
QFRDVGRMLKATKTKEGDIEIRTFKFDQDTIRRELVNLVNLHEYPLSMLNRKMKNRGKRKNEKKQRKTGNMRNWG